MNKLSAAGTIAAVTVLAASPLLGQAQPARGPQQGTIAATAGHHAAPRAALRAEPAVATSRGTHLARTVARAMCIPLWKSPPAELEA